MIGSRVVGLLESNGHDVVAASRESGIDVLTGKGLVDATSGADVMVDLTNSPSFDDDPVMDFFTRSSANLAAAGKQSGVGHYIALSIVGADGLPESGYLRAKMVQERTIVDSGMPYTIVRATQFQEFAEAITGSLDAGDEIRVPDALIQPIAADDVAAEVARVAVEPPLNGVVNIGGPDKISFADLVRTVLARQGVEKPVVVDSGATYFGTPVQQNSLVTGDGAALGTVRFDAPTR